MKPLFSIIFLFCFGLAIQAGTTPATVTVTNNEPVVNQDATRNVTFTATVSGNSGTPTGSVVFSLNGQNQPAVNLNNGSASFSVTLNAGDYTVTAQYAGDNTYATANGSTTLSLPKFQQILSIPAQNAVIYGQDFRINYIPFRRWGLYSSHSSNGTVSIYIDGVFAGTGNPLDPGFTVVQPSPGAHNFQ
ncbi:MAG TPA: Ig-like domain-containing protein, partial [Blastocatellia bacterium]|nr:Ig-like domain-containing protein [Blastocatellia bacterium]